VLCVALSLAASWLIPTRATAASSIPWGNVPCDPPPEGIPDPGTGQQCAYITVPLDYAHPAGRQILLAVSIVHADPAQRRGVLFLNPGGPGGPGLDMPRIMYYLLGQTLGPAQAAAVLSRYDLIGFDPRFVGHSTGASCGETAQQADQTFPPLEQSHSFAATAAFMHAVANGCAQNIGAATLPFATTADTARDMDVIRRDLGEDKINYFAWSYGTYLGAVYATLFPNNTDRVVLDSNVDPNWVWRTQFREWGYGGAVRWPDFANWAAANDSTYHLGNSPDQVTALYYQLYARADANPFPYPDVLTDGTLVNGPMFRELTFSYLEHDSFFPGIPPLWQAAMNAGSSAGGQMAPGTVSQTTPATLATQRDTRYASPAANPGPPPIPAALTPIPVDNKVASGLAIVCDDVAWSRSPGQYAAEYNADSETYPMFGALGSNIWPCAYWQSAPVEPPVQINSSGPSNVLMLQNLRDHDTPYIGALEMHSALGQRSRMVSVDEGGHAIFAWETNTCANDAAVAYLRDGIFPDQDLFCPANPPATASPQTTARDGRVRAALARRISQLTHPE
jgi:pimeloyl-ACP methyl ester carboxylesterase